MELCEGGELSKLLQKNGAFTDAEARTIMRRLMSALSYLHKSG
jgi:serine/threonine protein kinase